MTEFGKGEWLYVFNPSVDMLADTTISHEISISITVFFVMVKRMFPELPIAEAYQSFGKEISEEREKFLEYVYYFKNGRSVVSRLFKVVLGVIRASRRQSRLVHLTKGRITELFDYASKRCLLNMVPFDEDGLDTPLNRSKTKSHLQISALVNKLGRARSAVHISIIVLTLASVVLHRIETILVARLTKKVAAQGPMVEYDPVDLVGTLNEVTYWHPGLDGYCSDLAYLALDVLETNIYMRTLLSPITEVPATYHPHIVIRFRDKKRVFPRKAFYEHGVFVDETRAVGSGANSVTLRGCEVAGKCNVVVKITEFAADEVHAQKAASLMGFAPQLIANVFTVVNDVSEEAVGLMAKDDEKLQYKFAVYSMDRMHMTLREAFGLKRFIEADAHAILDLLIRFEANNFCHHDLKADNIMVEFDRHGHRRWYLIDYGTAWYGGTNYTPPPASSVTKAVTPSSSSSVTGASSSSSSSSLKTKTKTKMKTRITADDGGDEEKPVAVVGIDIPYGWDYRKARVRLPYHGYYGWPRKYFMRPPPRFDACSLVASLLFVEPIAPEDKRAFVTAFREHVQPYLFVDNETHWLYYQESPQDDRVNFWKLDHRDLPLYAFWY